MAVKAPPKDANTQDPTVETPVRVLGLDPMLENVEHQYGLDTADNSSAAFNLRGALEQSGMMAGVAQGARGSDDDTPQLRKEKEEAAAYLAAVRINNLYEELAFTQRELEDLWADIAALEAEEERDEQELLRLYEKKHELEEKIARLQEYTDRVQEVRNSLERDSLEFDQKMQQKFKDLSDAGLPDRALKIMHEEKPGYCSMYDFKVAVYRDQMTGKYTYKLPDGTPEGRTVEVIAD